MPRSESRTTTTGMADPDHPRSALLEAVLGQGDPDTLMAELREDILALGRGDLARPVGCGGQIGRALQSLQGDLRSLVRQTQRVGNGDFTGRVDFSGDLATAFNGMAERLGASLGASLDELEDAEEAIIALNTGLEDELGEHARAEEALRESELRYRVLLEVAPAPIVVSRISDGTVKLVNSRASKLFGAPDAGSASLVGTPVSQLYVEPSESEAVRLLAAEQSVVRDHETHLRRVGGQQTFWGLLSIVSTVIDGEAVLVSAFNDLTERKKMEEELRFLSFHDKLTSLYNRRYFEEELSRLQDGRQYPVSLVVLDVDGLKETNDTLGHAAGDQLLISAAATIRSAFRSDDVVARVGGDEFAVILPRTPKAVAAEVLRRLRTRLDSTSMGVSMGLETAASPEPLETVVSRADAAMYSDKVARRGEHR